MSMQRSEVARIRQQIILEIQACERVFHELAIIAPHQFITKRLEAISDYQAQLVPIVGAEAATKITFEAMEEGGSVE